MNNTFNFDRFCKVVSLDVKRYINQFGLTFLILCALPIVLWLLTLVFGFTMPRIARFGVAYIAVFLSAILVPSKAFGHINLQREGVSFAMLPASSLEKFLSIAILCILTPVLVMACSYAVDSLLVLLPFGGFDDFISGGFMKTMIDFLDGLMAGAEALDETDAIAKMSVMEMFDSMASSEELYMFISMFFTVGLFLLGNSLFKTHKTAKTFAVMLGVSYAVSMIMQTILLSGGFMTNLQDIADLMDFSLFISVMRKVFVTQEIIYALIAVGLFIGTFFKVKNQKY